MKILVLGAGVVGVTSAWYLAQDGHEVTVVERQEAAARETSFANGGQISVSHAEPWANPGAPLKALKWMGREDSPLLWRWRADLAQWRWGLDFLAECTPRRTRHNIGAIIRLGLHSRSQLQALRLHLGLGYQHLERGILHFYTDAEEYRRALQQAAVMREFGCDRKPVSAAECLRIEPALAASRVGLLGGTYTASDESGDARVFTEQLAKAAAAIGVRFEYGRTIAALEPAGDRLAGVRLADGARLAADAYVLALGSYSPLLLAPLGRRLAVYPAKGYSATLPLAADSHAPSVSLTDDGCKLVFSRLGERLRIAGTAEFAGYDTSLNRTRCEALMRRVGEIFPGLVTNGPAEFWAGLRPSTPGNVPVIGQGGYRNLWLNTGHGTLGWTLSCGSAQLLAGLLAGKAPAIDAVPYAPTL